VVIGQCRRDAPACRESSADAGAAAHRSIGDANAIRADA
jgi:hypothetical protein